jgi:dipeptidyl aminopeptidase/acylaminoacyl peptidase
VPELVAHLPPALVRGLRRLSPLRVAAELRCAVYLMHDRSDSFVPVTESRRLAARLWELGHPQVRYSEFELFEHVVPGRRLSLPTLVVEFKKFYLHLLALMRWLA